MAAPESRVLPDVAEVLAPILARVARERRPLLLALAERMAARRYRVWASDPVHAAHRSRLLACARREEEIAERIEALDPDAGAVQAELRAANPELEEIDRRLFAGRSADDQLRIQARGERLGAATWRSLARDDAGAVGETLRACALLEEENAVALESILAPGG